MSKLAKTIGTKILTIFRGKKMVALSQKFIYNTRSEVFEPKSAHQMPFSPEINEKSRALAENRHRKLKRSMDLTRGPGDGLPVSSSRHHTPAKNEILKFQSEITHQRLEDQRYQKDRKEAQECTFHPKINRKSADLARRASKTFPGELKSLKEAYERTFKKSKMVHSKSVIDSGRPGHKTNDPLDSECTFHPKITPFHRKATTEKVPYPKDFEKSVGRNRYAFDERMKKEERLNYINRGELLEFRRSLPANPPRCAEDYVVRASQPFIFLNINVRNGKKGLLGIRVDDIPEAKAEEFAAEFQLEADEQTQLEAVIREYIRDEFASRSR